MEVYMALLCPYLPYAIFFLALSLFCLFTWATKIKLTEPPTDIELLVAPRGLFWWHEAFMCTTEEGIGVAYGSITNLDKYRLIISKAIFENRKVCILFELDERYRGPKCFFIKKLKVL